MKFSFTVCFVFLSFGVIIAEDWKCDKASEKKLDELMAELLTFGTDRKYPETKKDLKPFCSKNYQLIKTIEEYNKKCLDSLSKQSVGLILYSIKSLIDSYCKKNSKYAESILTAAPCANNAFKEYNRCNMEYIDALMWSKTSIKNRKETIPQICCQYHKIWDCVHQRGKKVKGCTDNILDISEDFVKAHFDRVFSLLCADFGEQTDVCDKIKNVARPPNKNKKKRPKSFILPLVDLLKQLE